MSLVLEDGPVAGTFNCFRAPFWLRAVRAGDQLDVLDQLSDAPHDDEEVFVYEAVPGSLMSGLPAGMIVCPPQPMARGRYRWRADVDGRSVRETAAWRTWVRLQPVPPGVSLIDPLERRSRTAPRRATSGR